MEEAFSLFQMVGSWQLATFLYVKKLNEDVLWLFTMINLYFQQFYKTSLYVTKLDTNIRVTCEFSWHWLYVQCDL